MISWNLCFYFRLILYTYFIESVVILDQYRSTNALNVVGVLSFLI